MIKKHTQGPWYYRDNCIYNKYGESHGKPICAMYESQIYNGQHQSDEMCKNWQNNACLIAAAPELLDALEYAKGWFDSENYNSPLTDMINNAINKAKGV